MQGNKDQRIIAHILDYCDRIFETKSYFEKNTSQRQHDLTEKGCQACEFHRADSLFRDKIIVYIIFRRAYLLYTVLLRYRWISPAVLSVRTCSAISLASATDHLEILYLVFSTAFGLTLNSSSPKAINRGIINGSAAASPHIPTGISAHFAHSMICFMDLITEGSK